MAARGFAWLYGAAQAAEQNRAAIEAAKPPDPMEGLAKLHELEGHRHRPGAFFLGRVHPDHGGNFEIGIADDRHIFIMAGSRAGKGVSLGVQNALRWPGPLLMIDPKGEAASIAGMRRGTVERARGTGTSVRRFLGQKVAILDPFKETKGPARRYQVAYNPLSDIRMEEGGGVRQIRAAASAIIVPEEGNGAHFSENAETIICGVIEAVMLTEEPPKRTLVRCRELLMSRFEDLLSYLEKVTTRAGLAREAFSLIDDVGAEEWGSFKSTLSRNLKWLAEPDMQDHLQASSFSLWRAVQSGWSVFIVLPPDLIASNRSWLRLIVRTALSGKMALGTNQKGPQTLFFLDEFPALGAVKAIEDSAGFMAGYGIKLVPIIQNIGQLQNLYAKNWETFLGNAGAIIAFGLNDKGSETYIADRLGKIMVYETSASSNSGFGGASFSSGQSTNAGWRERPIRFPNQIRVEAARETMRAFVVPASGQGFTIERAPYMETEELAVFDSPDFIVEWEKRFGQRVK